MAAGVWKVYASAKRKIGSGTIPLGVTSAFRFQLFRASASAKLLLLSTLIGNGSVPGEISAAGGYATGGKQLSPATGKWTTGASTRQMKFTFTTAGVVFTGGPLNNIKYGAIRNSTGAGAGYMLCYCTLSATAFTVASGNTLTISPAATGVFTLA